MKEFKGTKQEWVRDGRMVYALQGDENRFYAAFYPGKCCSPDEALANAKLARAAPDLLNELKKLREYVINVCGVDDEDCDIEHPLMSSQAAISKALGEE